MLAGLYLCMKQAKHYGLTEDNVMDMVLWAVPCCIIGCPASIMFCSIWTFTGMRTAAWTGAPWSRIWDGGLAIYGAVIVGVIGGVDLHKAP